MVTIRRADRVLKTALAAWGFLFCFFSIFLHPAHGIQLSSEEKEWLAQHQTFRVSGPQAFPPFQYFNEKNEFVGMATDYLNYIAEDLGVTIDYAPKTPWAKVLEKIKQKDIDLLTCAAYSDDRAAFLRYSDSYLNFPLVIISRKDEHRIKSMKDLDGLTIALKPKITTDFHLKQNNVTYIPYHVATPAEALLAVSLGKADAAIDNLAAASHVISDRGYANLKIAAPTNIDSYSLSFAVRADWPILQAILNKSLAAIPDEKHQEIRQKWVAVRYEHGISYREVMQWIGLILLISSLFIGVVFFWNRSLVREIDERKRTEIKLRESERKLATLIGSLPGMAYRCRHEKNWPMEFLSEGCLGITGYTPAELSQETNIQYGDIILPEDKQKVWETVQTSVLKDQPYELEYRIIAKDGEIKWVWESGRKVFDIQSNKYYLEGFIADMTTQKQLSENLQQAQKMEAIGVLAGGIAHDFNNILSSVLGFTELALDETKKGSEQEENLKEALGAGNRAKELVQQILAFARQSDEQARPIRLADMVKEVLKLIRSSTPATITIKNTVESQATIMASSAQIHQLLMNLCTNAVQAMSEKGGLLEVELKEVHFQDDLSPQMQLSETKYLRLSVTDSGPGIDPRYVDKIFEPYFTTKTMAEGTGLGLATVKGIVESHGGTIEVTSTPNEKTCFIIDLPITTNIETEVPSAVVDLVTGSGHILFIDDEPAIVRMNQRILEGLEYTVTTSESSLEALEIFTANPDDFDLVITDMTMPHLTGDMLVSRLREIREDIPVILCTGYSNIITKESAAELGINSFLNKPATKNELAQAVHKVLGGTEKFN